MMHKRAMDSYSTMTSSAPSSSNSASAIADSFSSKLYNLEDRTSFSANTACFIIGMAL